MAIIHRATLTPSKKELIEGYLDWQPWGGSGDLTPVGTYRFDDPAGKVGVEGSLVKRGVDVLHIALTYRDAPLKGVREVGTMDHSVLGKRWVYEAAKDPVGRECFERALRGEQVQAVLEMYDGDQLVANPDPSVVLTLEATAEPETDEVGFAHVVRDVIPAPATARLIGTWDDGEGTRGTGVVAWLH